MTTTEKINQINLFSTSCGIYWAMRGYFEDPERSADKEKYEKVVDAYWRLMTGFKQVSGTKEFESL